MTHGPQLRRSFGTPAVYRLAGALVLATAMRAETLDRIAVTVDRYVIAESDVVLDLRIAAFLDDKAPDLSGASKRKTAERLVDLYLVLEDATVTRAPLPSEADVNALEAPVRGRYASEAAYVAALADAGISEGELREHLLAGLRMMRYTDLRFRSEVPVTDKDLQEAFSDLIAKQPHAASAKSPEANRASFEANRPQLEEFVMNRRVLEALDRWLAMTRGERKILYRDAAFQ
jgi:hypothetical protein